MAINLQLAEALNSVELRNGQVTGINDPGNYSKLTGCMNFLFSPQNPKTISVEMQKTADSSKYRPVTVSYLPKKGSSEVVTTDSSGNCNKTAARREIIQNLNPSLFVEDKFTIDENLIREGTADDLAKRLQIEIRDATRNCRESMDSQLLSAMASNVGANPAANTSKGGYTTIELLLSDGTVNAATFDDIKIHQRDNYQTGELSVIGLGKFAKYNNLLTVGGMRDNGVNIQAVDSVFGMKLWEDHATTDSLGNADRILVPYAGYNQFYQYSKYAGRDFEIMTPDSQQKTTINDPVWGPALKWDFILGYDNNCSTSNGQDGSWTGRVFTYFDLFTPPEEAFGEGYAANLNDFTGTVGYLVTQA